MLISIMRRYKNKHEHLTMKRGDQRTSKNPTLETKFQNVMFISLKVFLFQTTKESQVFFKEQYIVLNKIMCD